MPAIEGFHSIPSWEFKICIIVCGQTSVVPSDVCIDRFCERIVYIEKYFSLTLKDAKSFSLFSCISLLCNVKLLVEKQSFTFFLPLFYDRYRDAHFLALLSTTLHLNIKQNRHDMDNILHVLSLCEDITYP